ncbi:hypothetical protein HYPSUDRAFT_202355 [Hypholoma sublateritium FD-334 SS-4]|uniref:Bromodomain associated domain-containing protein n=1 Tax=Hypholoma sublateritium (strain FD-334 SS-4) TaxID=945553 RepID=A0A0D2PQD1_HYPSF|nr:hypothetical protein HYPSUDRAFT_202355 [Hypholoma sublateritium FD-334 SS-4]
MDSGAHKLLESATQRTLHAHAFSRSSSQASSVLTDLLSRYLSLLTSTCAKYSQHAGRTGLTVRDAIGALSELGVDIDELSDYCATEGKELNRYALYSARRVEDLHEFKSQLAEGLRQDHDDAIPLQYMRAPTPPEEGESDDEEDSDGWEEEGMDVDADPRVPNGHGNFEEEPMLVTDNEGEASGQLIHKRRQQRPSSPPLPLSPISNPSSPTRKRARFSNWEPPEYIPDFLPPFPTVSDEMPVSTSEVPPTPHMTPHIMPISAHVPEAAPEKQPITTLSQSLTSAAASDILVQVPYFQSSLSSVPEWHLPSAPSLSTSQPRQSPLPTPQVEPSLILAYHYILTHPPPPELPPLNPSRHKVAMALIKQAQSNDRWNPADTLFASVGPCTPRVATIQPSYPIAIGDTPGSKEGAEKDPKLPATASRPVAASERIAPFISQQTSRIPELARHILPVRKSLPTILARTSRLSNPPVLHRGSKPLLYGSGIAAPWNANALTTGPDGVIPTPVTMKPKETPTINGKDSPVKPVLPDARLYATWDYETKDFKAPLNSTAARGRNRMGSIQGSGSGVISLSGVSRNKGAK